MGSQGEEPPGSARRLQRGPRMAVVLVVNDDNDTLDMYESVLIALGHEPVTKETVASGPETVRDVGADALVVDLQRPDEDQYGLRIIEDLRADEETRAIPIILCTGAVDAVECGSASARSPRGTHRRQAVLDRGTGTSPSRRAGAACKSLTRGDEAAFFIELDARRYPDAPIRSPVTNQGVVYSTSSNAELPPSTWRSAICPTPGA